MLFPLNCGVTTLYTSFYCSDLFLLNIVSMLYKYKYKYCYSLYYPTFCYPYFEMHDLISTFPNLNDLPVLHWNTSSASMHYYSHLKQEESARERALCQLTECF